MELRKYVTKNEHRENDQEEPQTCLALRNTEDTYVPASVTGYTIARGTTNTSCLVVTAESGTTLFVIAGAWLAIYPGVGMCSYTDAEFNELYERVPQYGEEEYSDGAGPRPA
jgi:hypothetical protein